MEGQMTEEQKRLLQQLKATIPPDNPHTHGYTDTNQIRWEMLIELLETILTE
jgi:hypothetical protein